MTKNEYKLQTAALVKEFLAKGGKIQKVAPRGKRWDEVTFPNRFGSIWAKGYTRAAVSGFASVDSVKDIK